MSEEGRDEKGKFKQKNLYALGNTGGRPPTYSDANEMAKKIAEYIDYEDSLKPEDKFSKGGKGVYTLAGCALYLGFASRQQMWTYEQKDSEFGYVILRYKEMLTHLNEQKLYWGGTFAGAMFWLKNWGGYKDESNQNVNQTITEVTITEKKRDDT